MAENRNGRISQNMQLNDSFTGKQKKSVNTRGENVKTRGGTVIQGAVCTLCSLVSLYMSVYSHVNAMKKMPINIKERVIRKHRNTN